MHVVAGFASTLYGRIAYTHTALATAQNPDWTQSANRSQNYPSSQWYTGYAFDILQPGANAAAALEVLKRNAQSEMSAKIISNIKSTTSMLTQRTVTGGVEEISKDYTTSRCK